MADSEVLVDTNEMVILVGGLKSSGLNHTLVNMALSIDELRTKANDLRGNKASIPNRLQMNYQSLKQL